jgi:hypothetical protein
MDASSNPCVARGVIGHSPPLGRIASSAPDTWDTTIVAFRTVTSRSSAVDCSVASLNTL